MHRLSPVRIEEAKALSDETRIMILEMLKEKPMSVIEITEALARRGIRKTVNNIRYHLSILKDSGLVELVKTGNKLRYRARAHYYAFTAEDAKVMERLEKIASTIEQDLEKIVDKLIREKPEEIREIAESLKPCEFCITKHFVEHVIFEIIKTAAGTVIAKKMGNLRLDDKESLSSSPP